MRCSGVRSAIITKLRAITPDTKSSDQDAFKVLEIGNRELQGATDRTCTVLLTVPPARANAHLPQDLYTATFDITIAYADYPSVTDMIGDDGERISQAMEALPGENADIVNIDIAGTGVEELEGYLNTTYSMNVDYQIDSGV